MNFSRKIVIVFLIMGLVISLGSISLAAGNVEIKFFSNLPDRSSGQGALEQTLIDNYMEENPDVNITVEALQDEPYKQKFKAYIAGNQLPDIYMVWGQPSFFNPVMKNDYAAELNPDDYTDYNFFPGSLDGFSYNGKIYGLARNTDFMVIYYNKELFKENRIKLPITYNELIEATKAFREKGITPCSINGKDKWILSDFYQDLVVKISGDQDLIYNAVEQKIKFKNSPVLLEAAETFKELVEMGFFQDSFVAADYGSARNLFAQGKAAMYYMGSWEVGLATDQNLSEDFRENVAVIKFPAMKDGLGKATDLVGWNGGGYAVSANSPVKEEAIKLLNYMMKPENWAKMAWQKGLAIPAQKYSDFMTGNENNLQLELTNIIDSSSSISGTAYDDHATSSFKTDSETFIQELAAGLITAEEFLEANDKAAAKAQSTLNK